MEFCDSPLWNESLSWGIDRPSFTRCFEQTILSWAPTIFLLLFSPFGIFYIVTSQNKEIPWNWRNVSKLVTTVAIVLVCTIGYFRTLYTINVFHETPFVVMMNPPIKILSFVFTLVILIYNKKRGQCYSGLLFMFWLLTVICGTPQLVSESIALSNEDNDHPESVFYILVFGLNCVMLLLNFVADCPPSYFSRGPCQNPSPINMASFPSRLTFSWFTSFAILGYKRPLVFQDLWDVDKENSTKYVTAAFDKNWKKPNSFKDEKEKNPTTEKLMNGKRTSDFSHTGSEKIYAPIFPPLCKTFGGTFLFAALLKLLNDIMTFIHPILLKNLIQYVERGEENWHGYLYAALILIVGISQAICFSHYFNMVTLVGLRIRSALISAVYRKSLQLSNTSRSEFTIGEIVNLMAIDVQRFLELMSHLCTLWSAPFQIALALFFLWGILGPSVIAGMMIMIILIPINGYMVNKMKKYQIQQMKKKDQRVRTMNEILSGIKVLKLYGWEKSFEDQVKRIREKEVFILRKTAYLNTLMSFIWTCAPFIVSLVTFGFYVASSKDNVLTVEKAFVSLAYFNILRVPMKLLPMVISNFIQTTVSVKRLNSFLNADELDPSAVIEDESQAEALVIREGYFSWNLNEPPVLKNINLSIREGSLVAIVGPVGAGKSSLLSAALGITHKMQGVVTRKGKVAYAPQISWIQNSSIRKNILFGNELDLKSYHKAVNACALKEDLAMLPQGDETEVGEKGISLSGGQKQRVSLARAVYSGADIYLFDDPLSAVDSHVGKHIFESVIGPQGILRNKTRILVTHGVTFLPEVEHIIVLKDGLISEQGSYQTLIDKKGDFSAFIAQYYQESAQDEDDSSQVFDRQISSSSESSLRSMSRSLEKVCASKMTKDFAIGEVMETGRVKKEVYSYYLTAIGIVHTCGTLLFHTLFQTFAVGSNVWLAFWSEDKSIVDENENVDMDKQYMYLSVYGAIGIGQFVMILIASYFLFLGSLRAALLLHNNLLHSVLRVPMSFFDVTPIGRIMNRFSKDIDTLDNVLPGVLRGFLGCFYMILGIVCVICSTIPLFIAFLIPLTILYLFIQKFYVATSRQLKRLESVSRSPIYSHFGETITGTTSIRAYGAAGRFINESAEKVDFNVACFYPGIIGNRWLAVRLEAIGYIMQFIAATYFVISRNVAVGLVGLTLNYASQITAQLNWLVRMCADIENNVVAVERIKEYSETSLEAPWEGNKVNVKDDWPSLGEVEFKGLKVRYRDNTSLVLKDLTFTVKGGEKLGVVGRTGAGKSSLTLALFRIVEAESGAILIDGVDISQLGLHYLRSRLTIIPQDPVLFSGTLRINLDPFGSLPDEKLWKALELAHLKTLVQGFPNGLYHEISEGGENLSVGQRQLICLARALLRKTKILILDEATAAVDLETDDLIQNTIKMEFESCTVITIAHRINTIMDYDRILVLHKGSVAELDSPQILLANPNSLFYSLAHDAGLV